MNFEEFRALQKNTTINSLSVTYVDEGEGDTLLLIHGIPVWGYLWKDCINELKKKYRVIIPDLIGYGYSDKRDCFDRAVTAQASIIKKLLTDLEISEYYVVGHDIGGAVAQQFTVNNQNTVKKLILMDSVLYDSWPAEPMVKLGNPVQHYRIKDDQLAKKFIERLPQGIHHKEVATEEMLQGWMAPYMTDEGKLSLIRNAAALNTNHTMELLEDFRKMSIPILLLWGELDQFQPIMTAKKFLNEMPNTSLISIIDSDHFLPLERPDEVVKNIIDFCK